MTVFTIKDRLLKTEPLFLLGCTAVEATEYLRKEHGVECPIDEGLAGTMLTLGCEPWRVIWVGSVSPKPADLGVLLHEIFHLVTRICGDRGIPIVHHFANGETGDETAAYLFEFFAQRALKKLERRKDATGKVSEAAG